LQVRVRAPTKVTLFGEHSVVYGYPAIVFSLPIYIDVSATEHDDILIVTGPANVSSVDLVIKEDRIDVGPKTKKYLMRYISYILKAIERFSVPGIMIEIKSPLPVGAGLGTSAAVAVGTVAAISILKGLNVDKMEIAKLAWEVEKLVQGRASPMDTAASALGGVLWIEKKEEWNIEPLSVDEINLVIGVFEKQKTTASLVAEVAEKLKRNRLYSEVIKLMGEIAREARRALEDRDWKRLGELMKLNHAMLEALGVVTEETSRAVHYAIEAGALGAKVSGAGGGGAVVALAEDPIPVASAMKVSGAKKVFTVSEPSNGVEIL